MKFNFAKSIIAIGISSLIGYGFYCYHGLQDRLLIGVGSFIFLSISLLNGIGINFDLPRTTILVRTVSAIFFAVAVISNIIFTFYPVAKEMYIIINGILLLVYTLVGYSVYKAKQ